MAFAGVSVISDGMLTGGSSAPTTLNSGAPSGYHLLCVEGHSRSHGQPFGISCRTFTVGGHLWRIGYYPDGYGSSSDDLDFISLRLFKHPDGSSTSTAVKAQFEFSFVEETEKQDPARIRASRVFDILNGEISNQFIKRDDLLKSKHFNDDSFTIRCDVVVAEEDLASPFIEVPPSSMKQNLTDLLLTGEGTDVAFQVGGEKFAAHRCVLAARSAVFKALLFGPMKEGTSTAGIVQIDDMDAKVFKALLAFIYGDSLSVPAASTEDDEEDGGVVLLQHLLEAADRYDLRRLKVMCEKRLCEYIGVETATAILVLAEQHSSKGLKEECYKFLRCSANLKAVVATDGFDRLCRSCPPVIKDMFIGMLQAPK